MATLIPSIGTSAFDSTGERRLAERLEQKLDADYLLWHNVPIGPKQTHPDFVLLHPRRGLLILETKDWRLQAIQHATKQAWTILANGQPKVVINPMAQRKRPHRLRKRSGDYHPGADAIQVMTMKVSKGLEFPVVALPGVGHMPAPGEDETEAARVFYVAATRATQRLVMGVGGDGGLGQRLAQ